MEQTIPSSSAAGRGGIASKKEDIIELILQVAATASEKLDICADRSWVRLIANSRPLVEACNALLQKGVKLQLVTEIDANNFHYCKEIMKFGEVRHKDHVMEGIWTITEKDFISTLPQTDSQNLQYLSSTVKEVLTLQKFVYDRLWTRATPAEIRIQELEVGQGERTEIFYGAENAVRVIVESMAGVEKEMIACTEAASIDLVTKVEPIRKEYLSFRSRGVNFRSIFEITKENLAYCKELTQYAEIRHLDGIKGNFAVTEKEYLATATVGGKEPITQVIRSTSKVIMEQHRYFFESLWSKSIPAEQKIRELEEGIEVPRIEIIDDSRKSIDFAVDLMAKVQKEFLVSFATHHTFVLAVQMGALDSYKKMRERGATVKLLVPMSGDETDIQETVQKALAASPGVSIRLTESNLNTRITIMISDRKKFMTWELRDDRNEDPYEAAGIATYCNMESFAASYATIFDELWSMAELYEKVKLHDIAQSEFINIVAHELRTPIQPILGLAEMLKEDAGDDPEKTKMVDAIIKNATRLQNLQEDILEVARIESNMLCLNLSPIVFDKIIQTVVEEEQRIKTQKDVELHYDGRAVKDIVVQADGERISQVMRNLLENAFKFTSEGSIRVEAKSSNSGKEVIVSVKDTGIGIHHQIMPRLFQKFATKSSKGTGLGLYICRNIIESHGGKIWAANNSDQAGATFSFSLPAGTARKGQAKVQKRK